MEWFAAHCINHCSVIQLNDRPFKSLWFQCRRFYLNEKRNFPPPTHPPHRTPRHLPPNSPFAVFQAGYRSPLWLSYWMISPVCYRGYSTHCATASVNSLLWVRGVNFSEQRFELKPSHLRSPPPSPVSFQILLFHTASSGLDYGTAHEFAIKIDPSYFLISSSRRETASSLPRNIWVKQ